MIKPLSKKEILSNCLTDLHLLTIKRIFAETAHKATNETITYEEYLLELAEAELEERRINRTEKMLKESKLPIDKTAENFDFKRLPQKINQQFKTLAESDFLDRKENVIIFGNPGSGKTHIVCALGIELIKKNKKIFFTSCSLLVQDLLKAKSELRLSKYIKRLSAYDAIIIDDIGYVQQSREEMEVLFTLLSERYERGSVMITSNLTFSKWDSIFKDPMTTAAVVDRLIHHSIILELNVKSYRLEQSKASKPNNVENINK